MDRREIKMLLINDDDLNCKTEKLTLTDLSISDLNFLEKDLIEYDLIVYSGNKGVKIIKSKYFKKGKIT